MPTLSIIIVTKNEALNIKNCIESAAFADEVLIIDSGSTDNTVQIAIDAGATVLETTWPGYGPQQNKAIEHCKGDWIYSLDADERISESLAKEIIQAISNEEFLVFEVPRKSLFVDKFMNYSGWWPDKTKRLFKRGYAKFTTHEIHAHLSTTYAVGSLNEPMIHYSYRNLESVLEKMNRYSSGSSRDLNTHKKSSNLFDAITHGAWAFFNTYFLKRGFLDGEAGFILSIVNAETTYYKYLKHYYQKKHNSNDKA
jgi:glycosyltransferase involved in cell wall biosynthesis